ncbi:hypothetical protein E5D57_003701 [Metarhizium anisopliae]|nr:hypothetical protein E5D57_003701 [Metarhizium anisopliae]
MRRLRKAQVRVMALWVQQNFNVLVHRHVVAHPKLKEPGEAAGGRRPGELGLHCAAGRSGGVSPCWTPDRRTSTSPPMAPSELSVTTRVLVDVVLDVAGFLARVLATLNGCRAGIARFV